MSRSLSVAALAALLLVLPFEPRRPILPVLGLEVTLLETAAAAATAALFFSNRDRLRLVVDRPPLPLVLFWCFAAANGLSAAAAPMNRVLAAKFALRMVAAAAFALAVAAAPPEAPRRAVLALTVAGGVVAVLAILEGAGVVALDPFLDRFRAGAYWIGTSRRATAGSENPNLAAAMMLYGLVPAIGVAALRALPALAAVPLAALFSVGILFTYSRGGIFASAAALVTLGLALAARRRATARIPLAAVVTVLVASLVFAFWKQPLPKRLELASRGPAYAARYAPAETFLSLSPREQHEVGVALTNTGNRGWSVAVLGCTWRRAEGAPLTDWQATSVCPVTKVPPAAAGESVRVEAAIRAPEDNGRYVLLFDLFADGWAMTSLGIAPATVPAIVSRDPATARPFTYALPAAAWRRDRAFLWRTALAMWREHPLTGIGPDNFRWAHAADAAAGDGNVHETLVSTNNAFLEAAATTGTMGLIALLGTLGAAARACLRVLLGTFAGASDAVWAAVWLALIVAVAVHGTVDSFLGFTGHYLFLALVVGATSSGNILAPRPGGPDLAC